MLCGGKEKGADRCGKKIIYQLLVWFCLRSNSLRGRWIIPERPLLRGKHLQGMFDVYSVYFESYLISSFFHESLKITSFFCMWITIFALNPPIVLVNFFFLYLSLSEPLFFSEQACHPHRECVLFCSQLNFMILSNTRAFFIMLCQLSGKRSFNLLWLWPLWTTVSQQAFSVRCISLHFVPSLVKKAFEMQSDFKCISLFSLSRSE